MASGGLASCARDSTVGTPQGGIVSLGPTVTRATVTTLSSLQRDGFMVYGVSHDASSTMAWYPGIDGSNLHVFADGQWNFQTPVPWPDDAAKYPLTFYAWYPAYPSEMPDVTATPYPTLLRAPYTVKTLPAEQEDFVVGKEVAYDRPVTGNIYMTFRHVLSKIDIGVVSGKGAAPTIQALGVAYVGDMRTFDFVAGDWLSDQPSGTIARFPYFGTLDLFGSGSASTAPLWGPGPGSGDDTAYYPYTPEDGASMMLMPQTGPAYFRGPGRTVYNTRY